jgi:hypothetical protein
MKLIRTIGIAACVGMFISAFLPWIYVAPVHQTFTGMNTGSSNYGKPGILDLFFTLIILVFTLVNRIWSKRSNLLVAAFLLAWCLRNYLLFSRCAMGYCPDKKIGLYLSTLFGIIIFISTLFPTAPKNFKE